MITIKGTEEEIDFLIDCMVGRCDGCEAREACNKDEDQFEINEYTGERKSCGEVIREAINIIVEG